MKSQDMPERKSVRMSGATRKSCGFLSWSEAGSLEIELFDYSDSANSWFGNDVATIYAVAAEDYQRLLALSPKGKPAGSSQAGSVDPAEELAQLQRLANAYTDVDELIATLKSSEIPFSTKFDAWA